MAQIELTKNAIERAFGRRIKSDPICGLRKNKPVTNVRNISFSMSFDEHNSPIDQCVQKIQRTAIPPVRTEYFSEAENDNLQLTMIIK